MHEGVTLRQIVPTLKNVSPQSLPHTLNLKIYPSLKTMDPQTPGTLNEERLFFFELEIG